MALTGVVKNAVFMTNSCTVVQQDIVNVSIQLGDL